MSRLKLIYTPKYILAVDEAAEIKDGELKWFFDGSQWMAGINKGLTKRENHFKLIAHLPITENISGLLELPEMEDVNKIAEKILQSHPDYKAEGFSEYQNGRLNGIIEGYKARGGYTHDEMERCWNEAYMLPTLPLDKVRPTFKQFLQSLKPKYFEGEVKEGKLIGTYK